MAPFSSRFFRVPQQPYAADIHLEDSSGDEHSHFGPQEDDDYYDSIDGDTEPEISDDDSDYMDDLSDSMTDYDDEYQENDDADQLPIKIVAKIKNGTIIMNRNGEFVNKGVDDGCASNVSWLDEARASRKIADLEIEKTSLMALNSALESKVAQQADRIAKLEKQLHTNEWPLSPVSDKDVDEYTPCFDAATSTDILTEDEIANDQVFQRLRSMLLGLIEHAEEAVRLKTKSTGRVLTLCNEQVDKNVITLDPPPTPPVKSLKKQTPRQRSMPVTSSVTTTQEQKRPLRRSSDVTSESKRRQHSTSSTGSTRKRTSMERSLSRASSPAMLVTTTTKDVSPPIPPRPASAPMQRSSTTKSRPSRLRKSQDLESPKWHY